MKWIEKFPPMFAVRNGGEEPTQGMRGVWFIACTPTNDAYIQFHSLDETFQGVCICIRSFELNINHEKQTLEVKVITATGTEFIGEVIP